MRWKQELEEDKEKLILLLDQSEAINPKRDDKLRCLKGIISKKINNPINENNKKLEKIELLSSDFKGLFNVYGNDQIENRKMLKPTIIEKILRLSAHEDLSALTIDQDSIIAAFDCGYFQVGFEPNLFLVKPQTNNERIESIVNSINQAQSKAEKLYDLTT